MAPLRRGPTALAGAAALLLLLLLVTLAPATAVAAADADADADAAPVAPVASSASLAQAVAALCAADPTGDTRAAVLRALGDPGFGAAAPHDRPSRSLLAAAKAPVPSASAGAEGQTSSSSSSSPALAAAQAPWRPPKYPLGTRVLSEFLGMMFTIFVGESALANELLPSTKGHGMGWFATVWTFGLAFYVFLQIFGGVSAKLNPAMCLAQWIAGIITGVDFICLSLGEMAGAFCGACLVWVMYMPHFKSLPEPPSLAPEDELLRRRDVMQQNALQIASYNTRPERAVGWGKGAAAAAEQQRLAAVGEERTVHGATKGAQAGGGPFARVSAGGLSSGAADEGGAAAPTTPGAGKRAAATTAIIGAFDNFVYYLKPGVHMPRLDGVDGALLDADPWRDEEAVAERATAGAGGAAGGAGVGAPSSPVVAVGAHELAERYYQHDDQLERRRREHAQELSGAAAAPRLRSASTGGAVGANGGGAGSAGNSRGATPLPPLPRPKDLSRRTVQVADLQRHLADLHVAEVRRRVALARGGTIPPRPPLPQSPPPTAAAPSPAPGAAGAGGNSDNNNENNSSHNNNSGAADAKTTGFNLLPRLVGNLRPSSSAGTVGGGDKARDGGGGAEGGGGDSKHGEGSGRHRYLHHLHAPYIYPTPNKPPLDPAREAYARDCEAAWLLMTAEEKRAHRLYEAALEADRNAKLSIFATRPAIMSPGWNLIAESMGTFMLILCALLIELVPDVFLPPEARPLYVRGLQAFLIGIMVVVFISSLGGPTAYACNAARDAGPRMAHFVLPICNKGPSEWISYGWVPVLGSFAGGAAAGAAYHAIRYMCVQYQL